MSKAILVMDMPSCCDECDLNEVYCFVDNNDMCRAAGCPLREIPERKDETWDIMNMEDCYYNEGFNDCIDEILKEGAK